jgi:hypothetical protein
MPFFVASYKGTSSRYKRFAKLAGDIIDYGPFCFMGFFI